MANKRVLGVFTLNCLKTGHWDRVDYHIVMDWAHVLVIVQCQTDVCSLSCKDGAVAWQSFGQSAAGCRTILEMAVDDRRCPSSLVHFGAISVDFIMWSLCFTKLIELNLGFLSGDHAFTYSFNEVVCSWDHSHAFLVESWVSSGGRPIRHWSLQRSWLPLLWDQWPLPLCVVVVKKDIDCRMSQHVYYILTYFNLIIVTFHNVSIILNSLSRNVSEDHKQAYGPDLVRKTVPKYCQAQLSSTDIHRQNRDRFSFCRHMMLFQYLDDNLHRRLMKRLDFLPYQNCKS